MQRSEIDEHVLNTIEIFKNNICNICENECYSIKEVYQELKECYCPGTPDSEIFKRAHVQSNVMRRIDYEAHYYGPNEEGCIRLALAIGVDNEADIDYLLNARGYAGLSECNRKEYVIWRAAVSVIFQLQQERPDILPKDVVDIFKKLVKA